MNELITELKKRAEVMQAWRHHLHRYPEIAYEEFTTAEFIYEELKSFGFADDSIETGLAGTGIVASIKAEDPKLPPIALRADMDALAISERTGLPYQSEHPNRMHACGHDGHMAMLLGAADYLMTSARASLKRDVYFIFQPAEENEGGARRMIEDGLFEKCPCEEIYGLHNFPGYPEGVFSIREGAVMASYDTFDIVIEGKGGHAAMPDRAISPISIGARIVLSLERILSDEGIHEAVLSVTRLDAGTAYNIIPDTTLIRGTVRTLDPALQDRIETEIQTRCKQITQEYQAKARITYERRYPVTMNEAKATARAQRIVRDLFGDSALDTDGPVSMGSEDFSFLANQVRGCYARLGAGPTTQNASLHNSAYDFNDRLLPLGAAWWCALALA